MSLCSVHLAAMSTECCRTDSLVLWHISNSVLSSTSLYNGAGVSRSFIYTRKQLGPSNVPCGTPPLGCPGGEKCFPILTCWVRSNRKVAIHLRIWGGKSYCFNFASRILWLIRSKALLKSSSATLTEWSSLSVASDHLWIISTRVSVVEALPVHQIDFV